MGKLITLRLNNLTGGINTQAEENAVASFDFNGQGVRAEARDIENWEPLSRGGQSKVKGYTLLHDAGTAAITGLYQYIKASGTTYLVFSQGTKIYDYNGGTPADIGATINNGAYTHFTTALDLMIYCDGVSAVNTWNGSAVAALTTGADATAMTGTRQTLWTQNRLFGFGNTSNPSLLYYSNAGVINAGYSTNFINCNVNDGQKITAIAEYFLPAQNQNVIIVGKERSVGMIVGDGTVSAPYTYVVVNRDAGIPGFRQIVQIGDDIAYLTHKGISTFKTDTQSGNLQYVYVTERVRDQFVELNQSTLNTAFCWYDGRKSRVSFAVPESGKSVPNVIWHYDIATGCLYKERFGASETLTAAIVDKDGAWYHADNSANIYLHSSTDTSFNGASINAIYKTGYMDFGAPNAYKQLRAVRAVIRGDNNPLAITPFFDFGGRTGPIFLFRGKTNTASLWGAGIWGTALWATGAIVTREAHPAGWFRTLQLELVQNAANQHMEIFELQFDVELMETV